MSFRRTGDGSMKEALEAWMKELRLDRKVAEARILGQWPVLMGPAIANRTTGLHVRDGVLFFPELRGPASGVATIPDK